MHWQEAQKQKTGWANYIFLDERACIAGFLKMGWIILDTQNNLKLQAKTPQGVERVLEELELPPLGWY
jgi:hypothetical protein